MSAIGPISWRRVLLSVHGGATPWKINFAFALDGAPEPHAIASD